MHDSSPLAPHTRALKICVQVRVFDAPTGGSLLMSPQGLVTHERGRHLSKGKRINILYVFSIYQLLIRNLLLLSGATINSRRKGTILTDALGALLMKPNISCTKNMCMNTSIVGRTKRTVTAKSRLHCPFRANLTAQCHTHEDRTTKNRGITAAGR